MPYTPVWKDTYVDLGNVAAAPFTIILDSDSSVIYSGRAVRRPGDATLTVRVNDIVGDLLAANLLEIVSPFTDYKAFVEGVTLSGNGVTAALSFIADWSYDTSKTWNGNFILSDPVSMLVDGRQTLAVTGVFASGATATLLKTNGTSTTQAIGITGAGTFVLDLSTVANLAAVTVGGKTWRVESSCREWVLHYVNAYGGWDSLLLRGGWKQTDEINRYTHRRAYDNTQTAARGTVNYLNELSRSWTLNTGWLTDGESSRMHHLTESVLVYLENVATGDLYPVTVTDTTMEVKTYANQGRKPVNYAITVQLAADRRRK